MKILRTASLRSNFTGFYKLKSVKDTNYFSKIFLKHISRNVAFVETGSK